MKNRQKLTDDQLDAVSGGDLIDESAENAKKLDQMICPLCGQAVHGEFDVVRFLRCNSCDVYWTDAYGRWQRYTSRRSSSGC